MTVIYRYQPSSLLVGCRVRLAIEGAWYEGRVLQVDNYVANAAEAFVVIEDGEAKGSIVTMRVTKLRVIALPPEPSEHPYRGTT